MDKPSQVQVQKVLGVNLFDRSVTEMPPLASQVALKTSGCFTRASQRIHAAPRMLTCLQARRAALHTLPNDFGFILRTFIINYTSEQILVS